MKSNSYEWLMPIGIGIGIGVAIAIAIGFGTRVKPIAIPIPIPIATPPIRTWALFSEQSLCYGLIRTFARSFSGKNAEGGFTWTGWGPKDKGRPEGRPEAE